MIAIAMLSLAGLPPFPGFAAKFLIFKNVIAAGHAPVPGSVRVIGRRQIEMYARLIHTVDHVEGRLRDEFDARLQAHNCQSSPPPIPPHPT